MTGPESDVIARLVGPLRDAFDREFERAAGSGRTDREGILAVRVAGRAHALRIRELGGLFGDRRIVPVPGEDPALLGLAGVSGSLLPVYALACLLGYGTGPPCRWIVLCGGSEPLGLAFEVLEGYHPWDTSTGMAQPEGGGIAKHVESFIIIDGMHRGLIDVRSLVAGIKSAAGVNPGGIREV